MIRKSVDLPQPEGPTKTQNSPSFTVRLTPEITSVAPKDFEPLFSVHQWKGKEVLDAEAWCWGFLEGISLREAAWQPLIDSPQASLLRAIRLLGAEEIDEEEVKLVDDPMKCHKLAIEVEASVPQIQRFWKSTR